MIFPRHIIHQGFCRLQWIASRSSALAKVAQRKVGPSHQISGSCSAAADTAHPRSATCPQSRAWANWAKCFSANSWGSYGRTPCGSPACSSAHNTLTASGTTTYCTASATRCTRWGGKPRGCLGSSTSKTAGCTSRGDKLGWDISASRRNHSQEQIGNGQETMHVLGVNTGGIALARTDNAFSVDFTNLSNRNVQIDNSQARLISSFPSCNRDRSTQS